MLVLVYKVFFVYGVLVHYTVVDTTGLTSTIVLAVFVCDSGRGLLHPCHLVWP